MFGQQGTEFKMVPVEKEYVYSFSMDSRWSRKLKCTILFCDQNNNEVQISGLLKKVK